MEPTGTSSRTSAKPQAYQEPPAGNIGNIGSSVIPIASELSRKEADLRLLDKVCHEEFSQLSKSQEPSSDVSDIPSSDSELSVSPDALELFLKIVESNEDPFALKTEH